eukprot:gene27371-33060_t
MSASKVLTSPPPISKDPSLRLLKQRVATSRQQPNSSSLPNTDPSTDIEDRSHGSSSHSAVSNRINVRSNRNTSSSSALQAIEHMSFSDIPSHRLEIGLENLGNTCFMNSTLQCLLHIEPLVSYFLMGKMEGDLNPKSPKRGMIAASFHHLIQDIYRGKAGGQNGEGVGRGGAIAPVNFQRVVSAYAPYLMDYQQQDSQEFLRFLLDGMCEDLCRRRIPEAGDGGDAGSSPTHDPLPPSSSSKSQSQQTHVISHTHVRRASKTNGLGPGAEGILPSLPHLSPPLPSPRRSSSQRLRIETQQARAHNSNQEEEEEGLGQGQGQGQEEELAGQEGAGMTSQQVHASKLRLVKDLQLARAQQQQQQQQQNTSSAEAPATSTSVSTLPPAKPPSGSITSQIREVMSGRTLRLRRGNTPTQPQPLLSATLPLTDADENAPFPSSSSSTPPTTITSMFSTFPSILSGGGHHAPSPPISPRSLPSLYTYTGDRKLEGEAALAWERFLSANESIVTDLFAGLLLSTIQCMACQSMSHSFDPFLDISVPISKDPLPPHLAHTHSNSAQTSTSSSHGASSEAKSGILSTLRNIGAGGAGSGDAGRCTLEKCLAKFTAEELLEGENAYYCEKCKKKQVGRKQLMIYKYPKVLVIHIKRFKFQSRGYEKLSTDVVFPLRGLDLSPYVRKTEGTTVTREGSEGDGAGSVSLPPISPNLHAQSSSPTHKAASATQNQTQSPSNPTTTPAAPNPSSPPLPSSSSPLWQAVHATRTSHAPVYDLWGVSNHQGSVSAGHYIAHIYHSAQDKWVCYNDARVYTTSVSSLKGPSAYVLFYVLREGSGSSSAGDTERREE